MSKQQTAVEWLEECFESHWNYTQHARWDGLIHQAKQMEKEQIIQSWHNGYNNQSPMIDEENCGNTYYKQTYGGDHE
jgi:hypothetical protein